MSINKPKIFDGYCIPGTERDTVLPVDQLLRQMDEAGIEKAMIAPEDRELAIANIVGNNRIIQAAAEHPDRLVPCCGINPWYGPSVAAELERAVNKGARMLILAPAIQGFIPTDEITDSLFDCAAKLAVPVYIHTGPQSCGGPTQVVLLAEKHPQTNFIIGHCGSTDHARDMVVILENHRLNNLWFELSFVRPWVMPRYVELAGSTKFIWGSSSPRNNPCFELEQFDQHIPVSKYPDIYGGNLAKLLGQQK